MTQPPKTHAKKGSGNIVHNELSQTLECGATNQITPFAIINAQSAQFIMKIIFTKCRSNVPYGGARVQNMPEGLYDDFERAEDMESVLRSPLRDIRAILRHLLFTANHIIYERTNKGYRSLP